MYLSRNDIIERVEDLDIRTSISEFPFELEKQAKVCSIDLRIDNQFWKERKYFKSIDIKGGRLLDIAPRRLWSKRILKKGEAIILKPGEFILGRTYEKFRIPNDLAGKITGRSSYSRMGLETSFTCDLINPGWEGHVPIELKNNSKNSLKIYPYLPLVQVFLIPLSSKVNLDYSDSKKFKSKYLNDDGGPSFWWRDDMVSVLYKWLSEHSIPENFVEIVVEEFKDLDDQGIYRLDKFLHSITVSSISNTEDLKDRFAKSEKFSKIKYDVRRGLKLWFLPALTIISIKMLLSEVYTVKHIICWGSTFLSAILFVHEKFLTEKRHFYKR